MTLVLDVELTPEELRHVAGTDPRWWFTQFRFANGESPRHPRFEALEANNEFKRALVLDWLARLAPGSRVLDTFCANGAFSFEAARLGATKVLGVDFDPPRIECAEFVSGLLSAHGWDRAVPEFRPGDAYDLGAATGGERFDVVLCLGGLYHVADPVLVLRRLRSAAANGAHLLLQTSRLVWVPGQWARFSVREEDRRGSGLSSHRAGEGVWELSPGAVRAMLRVAGFQVVESRMPPIAKRRKFRWFAALARAV
ncbi:MAG TPA: methyltransferase domain-containing protein [Actinomycetota bacterium]